MALMSLLFWEISARPPQPSLHRPPVEPQHPLPPPPKRPPPPPRRRRRLATTNPAPDPTTIWDSPSSTRKRETRASEDCCRNLYRSLFDLSWVLRKMGVELKIC